MKLRYLPILAIAALMFAVPAFAQNPNPNPNAEALFQRHIAEHPELQRNPGLVNDPNYLRTHPAFANWLTMHPKVRDQAREMGTWDPEGNWHDRGWWQSHNPDWVRSNRPDWNGDGDWDERHEWHDRGWWVEHHPDWVRERHQDWMEHEREENAERRADVHAAHEERHLEHEREHAERRAEHQERKEERQEEHAEHHHHGND